MQHQFPTVGIFSLESVKACMEARSEFAMPSKGPTDEKSNVGFLLQVENVTAAIIEKGSPLTVSSSRQYATCQLWSDAIAEEGNVDVKGTEVNVLCEILLCSDLQGSSLLLITEFIIPFIFEQPTFAFMILQKSQKLAGSPSVLPLHAWICHARALAGKSTGQEDRHLHLSIGSNLRKFTNFTDLIKTWCYLSSTLN